MPEINRQLNLVIPITGGAVTLYAHCTPISLAVYGDFFLEISRTFAAIYNEKLGPVAGPRVAARLLRRVAGQLDNLEAVERGLIAEIHRLTNILAPGQNGWDTYPYDDAIRHKIITEEDASEIENAAVFFILIWYMHLKVDRRVILEAAAELWKWHVEPLNCTDYRASLRTLTTAASTGAKKA